jgi:hypothetical protein
VYRQEIGEKMGETEGNLGERERKKELKENHQAVKH